MQNKKQTILQRYNNTRRFVCSLNEQQLAMLIDALDDNNTLQITQTQVDSAYDEIDAAAYNAALAQIHAEAKAKLNL